MLESETVNIPVEGFGYTVHSPAEMLEIEILSVITYSTGYEVDKPYSSIAVMVIISVPFHELSVIKAVAIPLLLICREIVPEASADHRKFSGRVLSSEK